MCVLRLCGEKGQFPNRGICKYPISEGERKPVVIWTDCCRDGKVEEEASEADGDAQGWTTEGAVNHLREFEIYLVALRCGSQT